MDYECVFSMVMYSYKINVLRNLRSTVFLYQLQDKSFFFVFAYSTKANLKNLNPDIYKQLFDKLAISFSCNIYCHANQE